MQQILSWDEQITGLLNHFLPHNQFFNGLFTFLSGFGSSVLIWLIIIGLLVVFEEKKHRDFILSFFISIFSALILSSYVLKNIFQRVRPNIFLDAAKYCPTDFSFPSSHAAVAFAAATILSKYDKKRTIIYYSIAVLVGYSRIYLGCHFFLDVVVGGLFGFLLGMLILRAVKTQS